MNRTRRIALAAAVCLGLSLMLVAITSIGSEAGITQGPLRAHEPRKLIPVSESLTPTVHFTKAAKPDIAKVYLPAIYRPLGAPVLNPITEPEAHRTYTVTWSSVPAASSYELQQATSSDFAGAKPIFPISSSPYITDSQGIATYYYRVRALRGGFQSAWSGTQSVEVRWEGSPNNSSGDAVANHGGPLVSGNTYYGYHDDPKDYFYFDTGTTGPIVVDLTQYSGQGVQLQLFRGVPSAETRVAYCATPPYHLTYYEPEGVKEYYVYIFTASGGSITTPYELKAIFP